MVGCKNGIEASEPMQSSRKRRLSICPVKIVKRWCIQEAGDDGVGRKRRMTLERAEIRRGCCVIQELEDNDRYLAIE